MTYTTAGGWTADTSSNGGCLHRTPLGDVNAPFPSV